MRIRKNDTVLVTKGKDRGKQGVVQRTFKDQDKVVVEGINIVKRHTKAQGMSGADIIEKEMPLSVSNVMLICPHCLAPTKIAFKELGDGSKGRVCKKCPEVIE
ncbi:MAG: 50S ribosomal protein L24 [Dehalococcoidia bacterium]|tara:strand:- start:7257 stop:7565 length:309 start_codon:yes stop_codon:yes gene_type:complete